MPIEMMTQAGLDKIKKELADALAQRPVISAAIAEGRVYVAGDKLTLKVSSVKDRNRKSYVYTR